MVAAVPYPDMSFQIALNARPNSTDTPMWTDATELLTNADQISRGHPYQQPTGQGATATATIRDANELFNPGNPNSPFVLGVGGLTVQPYRGVAWQGMWPRTTGNLLNLGMWRTPADPSFESYTNGAGLPAWLVDANTSGNPSITTTNPFQGTKCATFGTGPTIAFPQYLYVNFQCIPGRYYIVSAYLRQTVANTMFIGLAGRAALQTSTAINSYVRLSGVIYADQPQLQLQMGAQSSSSASVMNADGIMIEPVTPVSPTAPYTPAASFSRTSSGYTAANGAKVAWSGAVAGRHIGSLQVTPDGVTSNPQALSPFFPVTGFTQYSLSGELYSPTSTTKRVIVRWYDSGQVFISASTVTLSAFTGWALAAPTAVQSPVNAAFARVGSDDSGVATTTWYQDHVDLLPPTPSAFTASGPVIYPVFWGSVESWPRRTESSGFEGYADLQLVDAFAALNAIKMHTEYAAAVLNTEPNYYYRLNEPSGTTFADSSGNGGPPLQRLDGIYGPAPTFNVGVATNIPGNPGQTGLQVDTNAVSANIPCSAAVAGAFNQPKISIGGASPAAWSMAFWLSRDVPSSLGGADQHTVVMVGKTLNLNGLQPGQISTYLTSNDGSPNTIKAVSSWPGAGATVTVTDNWADQRPHLYVITVTAASLGSAVITLYVDGAQVGTNTGTGGNWTQLVHSTVEVGDYIDPFGTTGVAAPSAPHGLYSDVALYSRALSSAEILDLYNAGGLGYAGEFPKDRILRRLGRNNYNTGTPCVPAPRLSTGRTLMGPSTATEKTPLLSDLQNTTGAEMGTLWVAPDGALSFESRDDRFLRLTPTMTFGEDYANGECPYQPDGVWGYDPLYLYADVQVSQSNGLTAVGGRLADIQAAEANFFGRAFSAGPFDMDDPGQVQDYADWTFYTHNTPTQRIDSITIDPMANPGLWPFALGVEIGQRVRVRRRPQGLAGGVVYDQQYFVEQVFHGGINLDSSSGAPWSWATRVSLTPIPAGSQPWLLNDPTWSVLGSTTRLGF